MHFSLYGEPKSRFEKTRLLNEESCNVTSAIRECCRAPAKVHLAMSNKNAWEQGPSVALGFTSPARESEDLDPRKGRSAHSFEEIFYSNKIAVV
jgi:hypothetical protein